MDGTVPVAILQSIILVGLDSKPVYEKFYYRKCTVNERKLRLMGKLLIICRIRAEIRIRVEQRYIANKETCFDTTRKVLGSTNIPYCTFPMLNINTHAS